MNPADLRPVRILTVYSAMTNLPLLFIDSGIGGLAYLLSARESLPEECFIYVADNMYFPYGEKDSRKVLDRVVAVVGRGIAEFNPKAAVIACNTASVIALEELRKRYDIPFVGVVPAVKPAAELSKGKKIGIFATNRTVRDAYTADLIREFASDCKIVSYPGAETVSYIEQKFFDAGEESREAYVSGIVRGFLEDGIDTLVLGCTHFTFIADLLQRKLEGRIEVIDSRRGVTRQLCRIVESIGPSDGPAAYESGMFSTGDGNRLFPLLAGRFNLPYRGVIRIEDSPA